MKQIGIITLYRGYNYGTSLQAYALKTFVASLGYKSTIIWTTQGAQRGRDIRLIKILRMARRMLLHPFLLKHTLRAYKNSLARPIDSIIKQKFSNFTEQYLQIHTLDHTGLKTFAKAPDTLACICGSDQIWNANSANVDPLYYLQFAPTHKRIAYAPSFGSKTIPCYNKNLISHYLKTIPYISVREESGAQLVKQITDKTVPVVLDPTLLLDWEEFNAKPLFENYIVMYFLDTPSQAALNCLHDISTKQHCQIIAFPYQYAAYKQFNNLIYYPAGPLEFISLIKHATCVLTDSFHGTIFSVNLQTPFWTFARNYASGKGQSDRIISILKKMNLLSHYIMQSDGRIQTIPADTAAMQAAKQWIMKERIVSCEFLQNILTQLENKNGK